MTRLLLTKDNLLKTTKIQYNSEKKGKFPEKRIKNLIISNFINQNNLNEVSNIKSFFPYTPDKKQNSNLIQSAKNMLLLSQLKREFGIKIKNNKEKVPDRKLTPDPIKKTFDLGLKRHLTPTTLKKQTSNKNINPFQIRFAEKEIKSPDINRFQQLFQG